MILAAATGVAPFLPPPATAKWSAQWPKKAFETPELQQTLADLLGGQTPVDGGVSLTVPAIAENGAQVRVAVHANLPKVETISLLVEKNPVPLTSQFSMPAGSKPDVSINLKVRETSNVIALVKADGKFYKASREVRVVAGGCG